MENHNRPDKEQLSVAPTQPHRPTPPAHGWPTRHTRRSRSRASVAAVVGVLAATAGVALVATPAGADAKPVTVTITLTPQACTPEPSTVPTGQIQFNVKNKDAGSVSEAELRTSDLSHILGEQENLTPGLSGGFALVVQPGHYLINCPGAAQPHARFTVAGTSKAKNWKTSAVLSRAVSQYATYVNQNAATLVSSSQSMCAAVTAGNQTLAEQLYPKSRIYYERIEPVAEVWGTLDTDIDGRIDNPVTDPTKLEGFHRIEEIMWDDNTLSGAATFCTGLVQHEQQLQQLVSTASYDPVTMASGATDLINEAATSKITGEEERYSNTDFIVFQANVDGAMEVVNLLKPYIQRVDPSLVSTIEQRYQKVENAIAKYKATPGYDTTGYVEYSTVLTPQRRQLSAIVQAFAESLSQMSGQVS